MIKGLYAAASSMLSNTTRQKILAHNISNLDTPGFKQILASVGDWEKTSVTLPMGREPNMTNMAYVGVLGLGVDAVTETDDYTDGAVKATGNELDLAISGQGWFGVNTPKGLRYTRDGRFVRDAVGNLVTIDGNAVLNQNGQPIKLPDGKIVIHSDGVIKVNDQEAGRIGLFGFTEPRKELVRAEGNLFAAAAAPTVTPSGSIQQGFLEMANADAAAIATQMAVVARTYEMAQKMVQNQDDLLAKTINTLGRI
ncbi:MAG TPA: flagellar hook-basal body protein [Anaerolineaceae bacterium]